ncbi:TetR/AcrR family transcriptional regulator [Xylanimonas sp. McL0601]|uniref:TetR/AcrR family transcriptional regulator n=1 Tax=Xylanimonas sp. McL0601 TaxID=3414739 RepID=UPI003CE881B1
MPRVGLSPDLLTSAAAELADDVGFPQVTLSALARRFGVQTASLYAHVADLDALRARVAVRALAELADRLAEALAGRSGRDALAALAQAQREYAVEHPGRWQATRHPLDAAAARASAGPRLADLNRAVLRGYDLPESEQVHAVRLLGATIHGYLDLQQSGSFDHSTPDADTSWERAVDALDTLLRHWPTREKDRA